MQKFDSSLFVGQSYINNDGVQLYLKVVSTTFLLVWFLSLKETTCQTRKNAFYLTSKSLFVLEKIKF